MISKLCFVFRGEILRGATICKIDKNWSSLPSTVCFGSLDSSSAPSFVDVWGAPEESAHHFAEGRSWVGARRTDREVGRQEGPARPQEWGLAAGCRGPCGCPARPNPASRPAVSFGVGSARPRLALASPGRSRGTARKSACGSGRATSSVKPALVSGLFSVAPAPPQPRPWPDGRCPDAFRRAWLSSSPSSAALLR